MRVQREVTEKEVLKLFEPPFTYDRETWCVYDAQKRQVLQIRGWSQLLKIENFMEDAVAIQDKFAQMVVDSFNEKYYRPKPNTPWKDKKK